MKCCRIKKRDWSKPTTEICTPINSDSIDFSQLNLNQKGAGVMGGLMGNYFKDRCRVLVVYDQNNFINPPPNFFLFDYNSLKKYMREQGDQSIFANIEPAPSIDIYDQYMYSDFQKHLDTLGKDIYEQMVLIFKLFIYETFTNTPPKKLPNISFEYTKTGDLLNYLDAKNYDLLLRIELGQLNKKICKGNIPQEGTLASTRFLGVSPNSLYFIPSNNIQLTYFSLNNGQTWEKLPIPNWDSNLIKVDELFILLNNTFKNLIPNYTISFEKVDILGVLPAQKFKLKMNIFVKPIPPDLKKDAIRSFQFKTSFDILCFKSYTIYKIPEDNVQGFISLDGKYIYDMHGNITFPDEIYMTTICNMTINAFSYQILIHEFMHALGFRHTHQINSANNPCRDADWTTPERRADYSNYLLLNPARDGPITIQDFDRSSIMTYQLGTASNTRIPDNGIFFHRNFRLSETDKANLRQYYSRPLPPPPPPPGGYSSKSNTQQNILTQFFSKYYLIILYVVIIIFILYNISQE
jgi:hypothetical protein